MIWWYYSVTTGLEKGRTRTVSLKIGVPGTHGLEETRIGFRTDLLYSDRKSTANSRDNLGITIRKEPCLTQQTSRKLFYAVG